jgi:hypothetical protein
VNDVEHFGIWSDYVKEYVEGGGELGVPVVVEAYFGGLQAVPTPEGDYDSVDQHLFGGSF